MSRDSHQRLIQALEAAAALMLLVAAGCDTGTTNSSPLTHHAAPAQLATNRSMAGEPGLPGYPGKNAQATRDYLASLTWADDDPYASATFDVRWNRGRETARIKVVPMSVAQEIDWQKSLAIHVPGGNGHFVARIYNVEHKKIPMLGMAENDTGYVWVGERYPLLVPGPHLPKRGAAVYVLKASGAALTHKNLPVNGFCKGQHPGPKVRSTTASDCIGGWPSSPLASLGSPASLASRQDTSGNVGQGLWVSCLGGCCEVRLASGN